MNHRSFRFVYVSLLWLLPFMANAETPSPSTSGVQGIILMSPSRPGPTRKDDVTAAMPVAKMSFDVQKGDQKITSFTTDAEGRFQVSLPPGHYVISRNDPGARVGRWRFEADVVTGEVLTVRWTGDSGMR